MKMEKKKIEKYENYTAQIGNMIEYDENGNTTSNKIEPRNSDLFRF